MSSNSVSATACASRINLRRPRSQFPTSPTDPNSLPPHSPFVPLDSPSFASASHQLVPTMSSAFVTPVVSLTTSSFVRSSLSPSNGRTVRMPTRRAARMVGDPPTPPEDMAIPDQESPAEEPVMSAESDLASDSVEVENMDSEDGDVTTEMMFEVPEVNESASEVDVAPCSPPQSFVNAERVSEARLKFRLHESDSGSPEFQIATLTTRISSLTAHLKTNPKDHSCTRGLVKLVATRRRLLKYLKGQDEDRFNNIVKGLGIRVSAQIRAL